MDHIMKQISCITKSKVTCLNNLIEELLVLFEDNNLLLHNLYHWKEVDW